MASKVIDHQSAPSTVSVLDLFNVPSTQVALEHGYWQEIHLANSCTSEGPWTFIVQSDPHYLHLNRNYIYIKMRILDSKGAPIATPAVAPINLLAKTLFKQIKVDLNGKVAYDSGAMYAYRTYLETELNHGWNTKSTTLRAAGYSKDEPPDRVDSTHNVGWEVRKRMFANGQTVELMAPIHCDLFLSDRLILSNTEVVLELHRNSDSFVLMSFEAGTGINPAPTYKLEILDMKWYVRKVQVMHSVQMGIEAVLRRTPAKYPIRRVAMTKVHITAGRQSVPTTPIFNGQIPRRVVIGFVKSDAYFGVLKKSPFMFENSGVKEISIHAGGQMYPREPLKMNFGLNQYVRAYIQLMEGLGIADELKGNHINMEDFKDTTCLFVFDLTPEEMDVSHWQLLHEGSTNVHCEFDTAIVDPGLEMIVYAEFDNLVLIDYTRTIHFDYSV